MRVGPDAPTTKLKPRKSWRRRLFKWVGIISLVVCLLLAGTFVFVFRRGLYNRFVRFPNEAEAWEELAKQRQEVTLDDGWKEYRGACHAHSELSHDSDASFPEILAAMKEADLEFIFMSDHWVDGKADYSLGWKGSHEGVLFIRGYEMSEGFMPWGLTDDTVFTKDQDPREIAGEIAEKNGVLFYAHSEEERMWDLPELTGMEIYNIHTDSKDEDLKALAPDLILSLRKYHDHAFRLIFDRQTDILEHWDELNKERKIVGIAANDAHQNTGFRGYYTEDGKFRLCGRAPDDDIGEYDLNFITRSLLWLAVGPLEPGRELFCITLDPYQISLRYVNTHLLAQDKTEATLVDALREGRVFIAFDMIGDARGFTYLAQAGDTKAVMGESIAFTPGLTLRAESPLPCRFVLVRDGEHVCEQEGRAFDRVVEQPGNYRIEAELDILDEWTPWVYTNPIYTTAAAPEVAAVR